MTIPTRIFLVVGFLSGVLFLFATPPFRYPDEVGHYLRAVDVAERLFDGKADIGDTVKLPQKIAADVERFTSRVAAVAHGRPFDLNEITSRVEIGPSGPPVERPTVTGVMVYHGIGYLPQALGFEIAKVLGGSFVLTLWAARLAVLLTSVVITGIALEMLPSWARWSGAAVSLMPMAAYLRGSAAVDAIVTAVTLVGIAALLQGARRDGVAWKPSLVALAVCLFLAAVKPPYACILLLGALWLPPFQRWHSRTGLACGILAGIGLATLAVAAWHSKDVSYFAAKLRPDLAPAEFAEADKLRILFASPLAVAAVFAKTLLAVPGIAYSLIGRFGWSDINPHPLMHGLFIAWCGGVIYLDRRAIAANATLKYGVVMLAAFVTQVLLVAFSIWLFWTETRATMVQSLQGRHFLPLFICGVWGVAALVLRPFAARIATEGQADPRLLPWFVAAGAALVLALAFMFVVLGEFYGIQGFHVICLHDMCKPG
jgi:hypothetical protein